MNNNYLLIVAFCWWCSLKHTCLIIFAGASFRRMGPHSLLAKLRLFNRNPIRKTRLHLMVRFPTMMEFPFNELKSMIDNIGKNMDKNSDFSMIFPANLGVSQFFPWFSPGFSHGKQPRSSHESNPGESSTSLVSWCDVLEMMR